MSKEIQNWSDEFMFTAEPSNARQGPVAHLTNATPDPLGQIALTAEAYMGRFYENAGKISDEQRRYYLDEMRKTKLKMPLESVTMNWHVQNVTRSFTHQMVRQRTAAYSQESMRFAVKEDAAEAVALPPTLAQFDAPYYSPESTEYTFGDAIWDKWKDSDSLPADRLQRQYVKWRRAVEMIGGVYMDLINDGMPAEDARGLTPHNIVTQLNYITNLRNMLDHAGNRLCTQAQFEWRLVWAKGFLTAMRGYCSNPSHKGGTQAYRDAMHERTTSDCDNWQWEAISEIFLPVCYQTGSCQFQAEFDRKCSIRERVQANAKVGRPSEDWDSAYSVPGFELLDDPRHNGKVGYSDLDFKEPVFIGAIHPAEWIADAAAAR